MSTILQDLRFALRMLRKSPGYTGIAVAMLALGIGANTAVFSVINAVLLRPLPYPQSDQLVIVRERMPLFETGSVSYPNYLDWCAAQRSFTGLALARRGSYNVSFPSASGVSPEQIATAEVSANFLSILGLHPKKGRDFTGAEDTPGGPKVVLVSDALWRRRFDADPAAVGRRILMDGVSREIVGVLPPELAWPRSAEMLVPLGDLRKDPNLLARDNHAGFTALGRLKPGVSPALANQDLNHIAAELERRYPESNTGRRVNAQDMLIYTVGDYRGSLYLLLGAVGCVLLIACANVTNLQLARASGREKELAVRAALGASCWRLMRQGLTESAVLGLLGGALALLVALWAMDAIIVLSPAKVPRFRETHLDLAALGFTAAVALGTGLLVGIWPAWRLSGVAAMATALHEGSARGGTGGSAQRRLRALLVVAQVALAIVLLACAALTLESFWHAQNEPVGFRPDGLLLLSVSLPDIRYPKEKIEPFYTQLLTRVRALPGVVSASTGNNLPFDDSEWDSTYHLTGTPDTPPGQAPQAEINYASPGYFQTMGIPLLRGRDFDAQDIIGHPRAVIIDDLFARANFPGQDPIGRHIDDNQTDEKNPPPLTVIGVVGHTLNNPPGGADSVFSKMVQMTYCSNQADQTNATLVIRVASGDPLRLADAVRREVQALDPDLPVADITTMERNIANGLTPRRLTMALLGTFALLALVLASIGLYGVMALTVTQRTRELGIRLALGAQRSNVLGLVMRHGATLVAVGLALGLAAALVAGRLMTSFLYHVSGNDPLTLGIVVFTLAGAALLACWLPALRATRVDPMVALRED